MADLPATGAAGLKWAVLQPGHSLPGAVADLLAAGLAEGNAFLDRASANWHRSDGPSHEPRAMMLVVFDGDIAVALAGVVVDNYADDPMIGRLKHVYVRPSYRRRGIADAMVRLCLARTETAFSRIRLRAATPEAGKLYERHGFVHHPGEPDFTHLREAPARPWGG